ncbi:hypothetical protein IV507_02020 [Acinetobacter nosocomialis]
MDKCREEFEQWFKTTQYFCNYFTDSDLNLNHRNEYENEIINGAWLTWQHQQAKVEELQTLYTQQGINMLKMQKRVDKALELMQKPVIVGEPTNYVCARFKELEQALKGGRTMKLRTIPHEYEAMQFKGITEELSDFLNGTGSKVYMQGEAFVLSGVIGNQGIDIGDYLYKTDSPLTLVHVAHKDKSFSKYFEALL